MRSDHPRVEPAGTEAAQAKYGLIVAALCAATMTVALAIASKLAPLAATFMG
jgi:hypothetical protein